MAFTVETGTGSSASNAYIDVAFADDYHVDRNNIGWQGSDVQKQAAIIKASEYIDKRFGQKFRGWKTRRTQAMEWPRLSAFDDDGYVIAGAGELPPALLKATAEYALRALTLGTLAPDPALNFKDRDAVNAGTTQSTGEGGAVQSQSKTVGPISVSTTFAQGGSTSKTSTGNSQVDGSMLPVFPEADMLLLELLENSGSRELRRG